MSKNEPPSLWQTFFLLVLFVVSIVALFEVIVYLFTRGAERLGLPTSAHVVIFVVVSGVFAWLVKRLTDTVSGMSKYWFAEPDDALFEERKRWNNE